ncbi:hypothetical protein B5X24_HaOG207100 [Helicoverpa armigera]|uniref:Uncharacterized protein n=1 Tax=Helicoverpa armigera TaxID=29058 RepID=A0A2W1BPN4_HELAM|nr:hypothetical protein B5X24_HaOG207100 [Helicoverpa armigera]
MHLPSCSCPMQLYFCVRCVLAGPAGDALQLIAPLLPAYSATDTLHTAHDQHCRGVSRGCGFASRTARPVQNF